MPFGARITFPCTNNEAEYEACILRLEEAINIQIKTLDVYGDSALVINQTNGKWYTPQPHLVPYRDYTRRLLIFF
jgi:ribonuclease HI